jgi:hypothetical protein
VSLLLYFLLAAGHASLGIHGEVIDDILVALEVHGSNVNLWLEGGLFDVNFFAPFGSGGNRVIAIVASVLLLFFLFQDHATAIRDLRVESVITLAPVGHDDVCELLVALCFVLDLIFHEFAQATDFESFGLLFALSMGCEQTTLLECSLAFLFKCDQLVLLFLSLLLCKLLSLHLSLLSIEGHPAYDTGWVGLALVMKTGLLKRVKVRLHSCLSPTYCFGILDELLRVVEHLEGLLVGPSLSLGCRVDSASQLSVLLSLFLHLGRPVVKVIVCHV